VALIVLLAAGAAQAKRPTFETVPPLRILLPTAVCGASEDSGRKTARYLTVFYAFGRHEDIDATIGVRQKHADILIEGITGVATSAAGAPLTPAIPTRIVDDPGRPGEEPACAPIDLPGIRLEKTHGKLGFNLIVFAIHESPAYFWFRESQGPEKPRELLDEQLALDPLDPRLRTLSTVKNRNDQTVAFSIDYGADAARRLEYFARTYSQYKELRKNWEASGQRGPLTLDLRFGN
jgi:hypothetical protein